jgi:predicted PurR-regulated permease PerM
MGSDMAKLTDQQPPARYSPPGAPRPPRVPADPSLQQRAWAALALAVLSLLSLMLIGNLRRGVYVVAVALVIAAIALWVALRVMSRSRRGGTSRPRGATLAVVLGAAGFIFSGFLLVGYAMFWPQLTQYANCLNGANTASTQQACQQQFDNSVNGEMRILGG